VQAPRKLAVLAANLQKPEGSRERPPAKRALHIEPTAARRGPGACQSMQPVGLVTSLHPYYYIPVQPLRLDRRHASELHVSAADVPYYDFAAVRL
jgi:hypothetical protein